MEPDNRFDLTEHAITRYERRHARGSTRAQARAALLGVLRDAAPLRGRTHAGQAIWRAVPEGGDPVHVVVKVDGGRRVVVTVLPPEAAEVGEERDESVDAEVLAAYERVRGLVERGIAGGTPRKEAAVRVSEATEQVCRPLREQVAALRQSRGALRQDVKELAASCCEVARVGDAPLPEGVARALARAESIESERASESSELDALRQRVPVLERRLETQLTHGKRMVGDRDKMRGLLRAAIRAAMRHRDDPLVMADLARIEAVESWFLREEFWGERAPVPGESEESA